MAVCVLFKLPITAAALTEVTESVDQAAFRRLWWAVDELVLESSYLGKMSLVCSAGLHQRLTNGSPAFSAELERAIAHLERKVTVELAA